MQKKSKKEITMDYLARIVQDGFLNIEGKMDKVEGRLENVEVKLENVETVMKDIKTDLNKKVDIFTHKDLEIRVEKVEEKVGIIH